MPISKVVPLLLIKFHNPLSLSVNKKIIIILRFTLGGLQTYSRAAGAEGAGSCTGTGSCESLGIRKGTVLS